MNWLYRALHWLLVWSFAAARGWRREPVYQYDADGPIVALDVGQDMLLGIIGGEKLRGVTKEGLLIGTDLTDKTTRLSWYDV